MIRKLDLSKLEPLYTKKIKCYICENTFTSLKVRSRFVKPLSVESDFGPVFKQEEPNNPLLYYVTVCPSCGFAFTEDSANYYGQMARKRVQEEITAKREQNHDYCGKRDFPKAVSTYKLAIFSGQLVEAKHIVLANLCLRLAWLYRGASRKEEEERFLELAASEYAQSYTYSDFDPQTTPEMKVLYLVGELNRRLGNYNKALQYFSTVTEHPEKSRYMKYVNLARQQWQLAVQEYKQEQLQSTNGITKE
jgi:uncharacterized protein (DUF2225 family)